MGGGYEILPHMLACALRSAARCSCRPPDAHAEQCPSAHGTCSAGGPTNTGTRGGGAAAASGAARLAATTPAAHMHACCAPRWLTGGEQLRDAAGDRARGRHQDPAHAASAAPGGPSTRAKAAARRAAAATQLIGGATRATRRVARARSHHHTPARAARAAPGGLTARAARARGHLHIPAHAARAASGGPTARAQAATPLSLHQERPDKPLPPGTRTRCRAAPRHGHAPRRACMHAATAHRREHNDAGPRGSSTTLSRESARPRPARRREHDDAGPPWQQQALLRACARPRPARRRSEQTRAPAAAASGCRGRAPDHDQLAGAASRHGPPRAAAGCRGRAPNTTTGPRGQQQAVAGVRPTRPRAPAGSSRLSRACAQHNPGSQARAKTEGPRGCWQPRRVPTTSRPQARCKRVRGAAHDQPRSCVRAPERPPTACGRRAVDGSRSPTTAGDSGTMCGAKPPQARPSGLGRAAHRRRARPSLTRGGVRRRLHLRLEGRVVNDDDKRRKVG